MTVNEACPKLERRFLLVTLPNGEEKRISVAFRRPRPEGLSLAYMGPVRRKTNSYIVALDWRIFLPTSGNGYKEPPEALMPFIRWALSWNHSPGTIGNLISRLCVAVDLWLKGKPICRQNVSGHTNRGLRHAMRTIRRWELITGQSIPEPFASVVAEIEAKC